MPINKVVVNDEIKLDLTGDTVTPETMTAGTTAHNAAGETIVGSMSFSTIYTGASAPDDSLGVDGDIFLVVI
ncbi:MAG: hypothetical protein ACI4XJ_08900 [Eubacteriales bacterium]